MMKSIIVCTALLIGCSPAPIVNEPVKPENPLSIDEQTNQQLYDQDSEFCETQPEPFVCMRELGWEL